MTLDEYMTRHNATGADLALRLGISEASVTRIRKGEQNISRDLMARIIRETGGKVKPEALVFPKGREAA